MGNKEYDIIIVGAGHAGCEAAAAAANLGSRVLLITMDMARMGQMSCNPAMGGIAKGQILREVDALGGYSGIVSDKTAIQFRMLNRSKGQAIWSPRTQNDRWRFSETWRIMLEKISNLDFRQDMVVAAKIKDKKVCGVITSSGVEIEADAVVLTNGTFLNGIIHIGEKQMGGGRAGEKSAKGITEQLVSLGFQSGRMKTGTPPRVDGRSLDYAMMEEQFGDKHFGGFSFKNIDKPKTQRSCHITYTNKNVHDILRNGFSRSPLFNGRIRGKGPRYCPSIEDKIDRFADKDRHQIFVEPEGWDTVEVYVNGFSTSMPEEIQEKALKAIPGFANAKMFRPGYAIEYDYFPPTQLSNSLETKLINNLFFAGQINGTTGYEEAACQGLMAGINAHLKINNNTPFILSRNQAYIGVLIDDLINKGTDEPYRMFTSRAEFRILLRQDNADLRLTQIGAKIGLADAERTSKVEEKIRHIEKLSMLTSVSSIYPEEINPVLVQNNSAIINQKVKADTIIKRPHIDFEAVCKRSNTLYKAINDMPEHIRKEVVEQVEINIKYAGYIAREKDNADKMLRLQELKLPKKIDYNKIKALSNEAISKLSNVRPATIGQATRISGVSPADISVLMLYMGR